MVVANGDGGADGDKAAAGGGTDVVMFAMMLEMMGRAMLVMTP